MEELQSDSFRLQALTCRAGGALETETEHKLVVDGSQLHH